MGESRELDVVVPSRVSAVRTAPQPVALDRPRVVVRLWTFLQVRPVVNYLDVDEYCRFATRLHWACLVKAAIPVLSCPPRLLLASIVAAFVLGVVAPGAAQVLLVIGAAAHAGNLGWRVLRWRVAAVIVTDRRLVCPSGVIGRKVCATNLQRVTNTEYQQSAIGRVLGYGTLRVESGGLHDEGAERELIRFVPNPEFVHRLLTGQRPGAT